MGKSRIVNLGLARLAYNECHDKGGAPKGKIPHLVLIFTIVTRENTMANKNTTKNRRKYGHI